MTHQITKETIAEQLHGRDFGSGTTLPGSIIDQAKRAGLIIVYGASDDLMEIRGAFTAELDADNGTIAYIDAEGTVERPDETDRMLDDRFCKEVARYIARRSTAATIEVIWQQGGTAWRYKTAIPHATFNLMDDEDVYCEGMVIDTKDLPMAIDWQRLAEIRKEKIQSLSEFLDGLALMVGIEKPETPVEGIGTVQELITRIQLLQWEQPRARAAIDQLRTILGDADRYLDTNKLTTIGSGSGFHQAFKKALKETELFRSPGKGPTYIDLHHELQEIHQARQITEGTCSWTQPAGTDLEDSDAYIAACDGSTVTLNGPASETDMQRCYRCGRKLVTA